MVRVVLSKWQMYWQCSMNIGHRIKSACWGRYRCGCHVAPLHSVPMIDLAKVRNYYISCGYTDLSLGIDGLAAVVTQQYGSHMDEKVCSCSAADEQTELKLYTGVATDISICTRDYPTEDFNDPGQKQSYEYWITKAFGGLWRDFVSSRKLLSKKENQRICSEKNVWFS